ncbi:MAG: ABC transporter permease [Ferruginibacter sp.]|nr:ABC transporter permease [Ferruginibacter sp.]
MRKSWWKISSVLLLIYTVAGGMLMDVPRLFILNETIRNLYFHVSMWFVMMILFTVSLVYSIRYLSGYQYRNDLYARHFAETGFFFGILGYVTGAIWANYTWVTDQGQSLGSILKEPKLIGAAIAVLMYGAYFVLRGSFTDLDKRARVCAVYNIFAYAMLFPSIWIIPRLVGSLHPGAPGSDSGNPALNFNDIDSRLRLVFYPAILGWALLAVWITTLKIRIDLIKDKTLLHDESHS